MGNLILIHCGFFSYVVSGTHGPDCGELYDFEWNHQLFTVTRTQEIPKVGQCPFPIFVG
jgi:hypothetical protein